MTTAPLLIRDVDHLRQVVRDWRKAGLKSALVPTMGALHDGHIALAREGLKRADRVLVTIFVNPRQFAPHEDLARYPRDEAGDIAKLAGAGVSAVFLPSPDVIYPPDFATAITMQGPAKAGLEDKFRPHFFDGVATVVAKLFIMAEADCAIFGEKDYQQLLVVRRMAQDLNIATQVVGLATVREADGLAMSSRNRYLDAAERKLALSIHQNLTEAAKAIRGGKNAQSATDAAAQSLIAQGFKVDYVAWRNADTLAEPKGAKEPTRLLAAAWLGKTRLIDNIPV